MKKITFSILICLISTLSFGQVVINELDSDQTGTDNAEFIELKTTNPNTSLDGYVVVLYNGSSDESYAAYDLDGYTTDSNGLFILGNGTIANPDISLGTLQNGADAVAIYSGDDTDFPNDTPVTSTNLIDALVYGTSDSDDTELLTGLNQTVQYDENINGNKDTESIQRGTGGTFCVGNPTPDAMNINCSTVCPLNITIDNVICESISSGTDTYSVTASFTGGGTETYSYTFSAGNLDMVNSNDPSTDTSGQIIITGIPEGTDLDYTITSTTCNISDNITSPSCQPAVQVSDISELRLGTVGNTYTLTGEAVITFQRETRNQYIEDNSAAILIDDDAGIITTTYNVGDGITGITGELSEYNGVLQFVPESDPGATTSTGNTITPQIITLADFNNNPNDYESEVITFQNITIADITDGNGTFQGGESYDISNGSETSILRTNFFDADYIGNQIPTGTINLVGLGAEFNGTAQIYPRNSNDIDANLAVENATISEFSLYPNPTSTGTVQIKTAKNTEAEVAIFNILGQKVLAQKLTSNAVNVSTLQSGVYLVKVIQDGKATTKKLIIE
ncbi:T9SS type A sorting domain-containing protein [Mesonia maritima]|uniref:T9SS type A sorting domain-containing protein n=1 Tax=Mesonia maritima TaxID=1793873 RepID=UPI003636F182